MKSFKLYPTVALVLDDNRFFEWGSSVENTDFNFVDINKLQNFCSVVLIPTEAMLMGWRWCGTSSERGFIWWNVTWAFFMTQFLYQAICTQRTNSKGTRVIVGSMNMGYVSDTARTQTYNLFGLKRVQIPLGQSNGF